MRNAMLDMIRGQLPRIGLMPGMQRVTAAEETGEPIAPTTVERDSPLRLRWQRSATGVLECTWERTQRS